MTKRTSTILIMAAAAVPFWPAFHAGFLVWDDRVNLVTNAAYRGFALANLRWMLVTRHQGPWQPLSWFSYAVDYALWGLNAAAMRRTNFALHAAAAALFFLVARRLIAAAKPSRGEFAAGMGAAAAAIFFAWHPLRVESVVWLTERRDVLSGAFMMGAWLCHLEEFPIAALILYAAALLSKGTAFVLPLFLLAEEIYPFDRPIRDSFRRILPFFALAIVVGAIGLWGFSTGAVTAPALTMWQRILVTAHSPGFYFVKTFAPLNLSPYYSLPHDWSAGARALSIYAGLTAALTFAAWKFRREYSAVWVWWLAYLAAVIPVSGLFQNGAQAAADRYTYAAAIPLALAVGEAASILSARKLKFALAGVAAAAALLFALTWRQSRYWRDDRALWEHAVALDGDAYLPRSNYADALMSYGESADAIAQYSEVLRIQPNDAHALINRGTLNLERGRLDAAESDCRAVLALVPGEPSAATNLARIFLEQKNRPAAIEQLEDVVRLHPNFAAARFNLGLLLVSSGRRDEGLSQIRRAVELDPALALRLKAGKK